jgi:hypothetical protein
MREKQSAADEILSRLEELYQKGLIDIAAAIEESSKSERPSLKIFYPEQNTQENQDNDGQRRV